MELDLGEELSDIFRFYLIYGDNILTYNQFNT